MAGRPARHVFAVKPRLSSPRHIIWRPPIVKRGHVLIRDPEQDLPVMIFRFLSHRAGIVPAALLTVSLAVAALVAPASAQQDQVRGDYGWWQLRCSTPAGATSEQCVLIQNVVADDRPELGLSVVAFKTADRTAQILRIQVPLGVLLPNGLGLHIDGNDMGRAYFVRCFADGCYAEVILEDQLLESLKAGSEATFTVFDTPEEGIGIPVDLAGFSEGFEALP